MKLKVSSRGGGVRAVLPGSWNQCALDFDRLTRKPDLWKFSTRAKSPTLGGCL